MILPDLSDLAFSDFVGIFSLPNSKLITISFETVLDVNGLPTVRLTLGYGRKVLDLSLLPARLNTLIPFLAFVQLAKQAVGCAVLAMGRIEAGSLLELFDGATFVS